MRRLREIPITAVTFLILAVIWGFFVPDFCHAGLKWRSIGPEGGRVASLPSG